MVSNFWRWWLAWLVLGLLGGVVGAGENTPPEGEGTQPVAVPEAPAEEQMTDPYGLGAERFSLAREMELAGPATEAIEKDFGVVEDEALLQRVNEIGAKIVTAAEQVGPRQIITDPVAPGTEPPRLQFTFKVLNSDEVNAFSLWGGHIYVTRGLLDYVQSDDELVAVLAHELGHAMRHHLNKQQRVERTATNYQLWAFIAALMAGEKGEDIGNILLVGEWAKYAAVSAHSVKDEVEADYLGVLYCYRAGYNPVGLLSFMQRLARDSYATPAIRETPTRPGLGAAQTHPWSDDRARSIRRQIVNQLHLPVDILDVIALPSIEARSATVKGKEIAEVLFGETVICQLADPGKQTSPLARAQAVAAELLRLLDEEKLHARHLRLDRNKPLIKALLRGKEVQIVEILPGDADFQGQEASALARKAYQALRGALQIYELHNQKI